MQVLTDQEFTYRESPAEQDGYGKFKALYGNTLVWNQLYQNTNIPTSQTKNGVTLTNNNDGSWTLSGTATANTYFYGYNGDIKPIVGHKYLMKDCVPNGANSFYCIFDGVRIDVPRNNIIVTATSTTTGNGTALQILSGVTVNVTFHPQIFDLTQMFGSGNEPSTIEEFTSLFPLSYYSYNQGSLLSFNGNGIKTVGFNQWDEEWEVGGVDIRNGVPVGGSNQIRSKNFCPLIGGKTYYLTCGKTDGGSQNRFYLAICFYDVEQKFISATYANNLTFVAPSNASYFKLTTNSSTVVYGNTYNNDICVNISSSRNGEYEPYTSSTLSLPVSTYFPNGMKSAGSVYDELTESKAITRIGMVDLGTLSWQEQSTATAGKNRFRSVMPTNAKIQTSDTTNKKSTCSKYALIEPGKTYQNIDGYTISVVGGSALYVYVYDSSMASLNASDFKTAMSGVYLYYELATPTETSFSTPQSKDEYPFFKSYKGGTEQLLPENGSVPVTAPILADMNYSSGAIEVTTYPNPEQGGETSGDGWYLVGEEATVNALPNEHYAFNNWVLDGEIVSTDPEYTFEVKDE